MKRTQLLLSALLVCASICVRADVIVQWTFEINTPADLTDSATILGIPADFGLGTASGVHASTATDWTTPVGNGSANSLNANNWAVGDYYQFQFSTVGYSGIGISFDATSSNTGPRDYDLLYSVNGDPFTAIGSYSVLANAAPNPVWTSGTYNPIYTFFFDLSSIAALDNATSVEIRLQNSSTVSANGGAVAATGTSRIDNFTVFTPVPEPSAIVLAVLGGLMGFALLRRKR